MKIELNINGITHTAEAQPWMLAPILKYFGFNSDLLFPELEQIIDLIGSRQFSGKLAEILSGLQFLPPVSFVDLNYRSHESFALNAEIGDLLDLIYTVLIQSINGFERIGVAVDPSLTIASLTPPADLLIALPEMELTPQPIELVATEPQQNIDLVLNELADQAEPKPKPLTINQKRRREQILAELEELEKGVNQSGT
jgi:hypothetical protein